MFFKKIESEGLAHFSYMIGDEKELAVIDPRRDIQIYLDTANEEGMRITTILETHRNEDYIVGSIELAEKSGATIYLSGHEDLGHVYGKKIEDGHTFDVGGLKIKAIHTPGHTLGHLCYAVYESDRDEAFMVFTGDSLFMGDLGRTDFYGKDNLEKMTGLLYESIVDKLYPLGDHVLAYPAHGFGSACGASMEDRSITTIGYERLFNPELQVESKEEFIEKFGRMRLKPRYFEVMEEKNIKGAPFINHTTSLPALTMDEIEQQNIQLFDVRAKEAYFGGHIPGSIFLSRRNFSVYGGNLVSVDTPIAFIVPDDSMEIVMDFYYMARRIGFDDVRGYVPKALDNWEIAGKEVGKIDTIAAEDFHDLIGDFNLLDVRKPASLSENDPVKNRINIPLEEMYQDYDKVPKDRAIFTMCATGDRATTASSFLKTKGIQTLVIEGGMQALEKTK